MQLSGGLAEETTAQRSPPPPPPAYVNTKLQLAKSVLVGEDKELARNFTDVYKSSFTVVC